MTSALPSRLFEEWPGALMSPCAEVAARLLASSQRHWGAEWLTTSMAGSAIAATRTADCSARLRSDAPETRSQIQTRPESWGLRARLMARAATPSQASFCLTKHHTALAHS